MDEEKIYSLIALFCLNLFLISVIIIILSFFSFVLFNSPSTINIIFVLGTVFGLLALFFWEKSQSEGYQSLFRFAPIILLILLFIIAVDNIFHLIGKCIVNAIVLAIILGIVTLFNNMKKIKGQIRQEKRDEKIEEKIRYKEFGIKFKKINKLWGLRSLIRFMYKEGWGYSFGLILIVITGFIIRIYSSFFHNFWIDEVASATAVKSILERGVPLLPSGTFYSRDILYHYLVSGFVLIFGDSQFVMRLPSIFFGLGVIIATYFLAKMLYGKKAALISAFIICFLSFGVIWSTQLRFYIALQFFALLSILAFFNFIKDYKQSKFFLFISVYLVTLFISFQGLVLIVLFGLEFLRNKTLRSVSIDILKKRKVILALVLLFFVLFLIFSKAGTAFILITNSLMHPENHFSEYYKAVLEFLPYSFFFFISSLPLLISQRRLRALLFYTLSLFLYALFFWQAPWLRYILIALPLIIVFTSVYLRSLDIIYKRKKLFYLFFIVTIAIFLISTFANGEINFYPNKQNTHIQEPLANFNLAYSCIYENLNSSQIVVSITTGNHPASYYLSDKFNVKNNYILTYNLDKYVDFYRAYNINNTWYEGYSNTRIITSYEEFLNLIEMSDSGWVVFDQQKKYHVDTKTKEFFNSRLTKLVDCSDDSVYVYHWNSATIIPNNLQLQK